MFIYVSCFMALAQTPEAKDSWHFKSPLDDFQVVAMDNRLFVGDAPVNKKNFDDFLRLLLKANREDCPPLGVPELTVEAKSGSTLVTKKFYPVEGVVEASGKCATLDFDAGWSLPYHRDWFTGDTNGKIVVGLSMMFKSKDLSFQLFKKGDEWSSSGKGFIPDSTRMGSFARAADSFKVEKRYSKKIKSQVARSFTLSTGGQTLHLYNIHGLWAVEFPKSHELVATSDFSMLGKFTKNELGDNRSDEMNQLADKNLPPTERTAILDKLANVDSTVFRNTLHQIIKDPDENPGLKERVAILLVDRPSRENVKVMMDLIEKSNLKDQSMASKVLRRLNPVGPYIIADDVGPELDEKLKKWKDWYAKYRQAQR